MFCSVKKGKDKYGNIYKFYLCNRYRDKETGKVKSSDKYIMTLQEIDFTDLRVSFMANHIKRVLNEKNIVNEIEQDLVYDKYLDIREKILERGKIKRKNIKSSKKNMRNIENTIIHIIVVLVVVQVL